MKIKLNKQSWHDILEKVFESNALLDHGYMHPEEQAEYLSEHFINIDFNKMTIEKP